MSSNHKFSVLDKGSVELLGMFGDELTIVNAARVSFGAAKSELDKKDVRLIKYLYKHKHMSPFRHLMFRFRIKAPEFVMRQFYKHVIGCETTSSDSTKDHAWNEISGRYKAFGALLYNYRLADNDFGAFAFPTYIGLSLESGNVWNTSEDVDLSDTISAGSLSIGVASNIGPVILSYGKTNTGEESVYMFLGTIFFLIRIFCF